MSALRRIWIRFRWGPNMDRFEMQPGEVRRIPEPHADICLLRELRELAENATPGPWLPHGQDDPAMPRVDQLPEFPWGTVAWVPPGRVGRDEANATAEFIAAASPETIKALIGLVDSLHAALQYIASPTMGRPSTVSPYDWVEHIDERSAKAALKACIWSATHAEALLDSFGSVLPTDATGYERDPACVKAWPECVSGGYDPRCCRFPKSCSCMVQGKP